MRRLAALLALWPAVALAEETVLLFGGGYRPEAGQVQIELNLRWIQRYYQDRGVALRSYYGAGGREGVRDVVERAGTATLTEPLARVFGDPRNDSDTYYPARVEGSTGGIELETVRAGIDAAIRGLAPGDRLDLVYQGHGGLGADDTADNALRLWHDEPLTARALAALLDHAPGGARVRVFFPQCYSGGFARIIRREAAASGTLASGDRCGFFAQDELLESEGCTPSVDVGDYRDYSSYFFAALSGRGRDGAALTRDPDRDHDGRVSWREAHFYALLTAESADLPFSTSEYYLERWPSWALRWAGSERAENEYSALADELAARHPDPRAEHRAARDALGRIAARRAELAPRIAALRATLAWRVEERHPAVRHPYSSGFAALMRGELEALSTFVRADPDYAELARLQDESARLELEALSARRTAIGVERYERLRRLAQLRARFDRLATEAERAELRRLVACEEG